MDALTVTMGLIAFELALIGYLLWASNRIVMRQVNAIIYVYHVLYAIHDTITQPMPERPLPADDIPIHFYDSTKAGNA